MGNFVQRARSFALRAGWLGHYMPGRCLDAALHLVKIKLSPKTMGAGKYKKLSFIFAPRDMSAIKEVLEDQEYKFLEPVLKSIERPVVLDAGSHIGLFALWAFGCNPKSRILSIEASPDTYVTTRANCAAAKAQGYDWKVVHAAAWSEPGFVSFCADGETMGHHISAKGGNVQVPTITLADAIAAAAMDFGNVPIDIMKVDIEGAEEAFLMPAETMLADIRHLVIELHPEKCDTDKVRAMLSRHYKSVVNCEDRASRKPLLHCYN